MARSSEKNGDALLETPARVESAAGLKRNINPITYRRKHWRREKETKSSRNDVAAWNVIPEIKVDAKALDVPAPVTPVSVMEKHQKRVMPPKKTEPSECKSLEPCQPESSTMEIEQFTYECKEGLKETCRRSPSLNTRKFKRKGGKDFMLDETDKNNVIFCLHMDDKPSSLSEDDQEMTVKGHDAMHFNRSQSCIVYCRRRKQVIKMEKKASTIEQKKLICSSPSSDSGKEDSNMEKPDSEGMEELDEDGRKWCEKESALLYERVKSFIFTMRLILGEMQFSPWKGSVVDSIVGAYLTQNVNDTLSSSAFMSLAAKYPHGAVRVNSPVEASIRKKKSATSKMDLQKEKPIKTKNSFGTKRKSVSEDCDDMHFRMLEEYHSNFESKKRTHKTSDALDWDSVRMAQIDDISKAIQIRGMNNNLAGRIKNCLNILVENFGSTDMEWLREVPPHKAKEYLLSIFGLGLKSVECICLLTLRQKAFPIDRNAARVAVRLGWVPLQALPEGEEFHLLKEYPTANSIHNYLWPLLSTLDHSILYELHCQMITSAKAFCTKINPNCNACPMRATCKHFASVLASTQPPLLKVNCSKSVCNQEAEHVTESTCFCPKCRQMVQDSGRDIEDLIQVDELMLKKNIHFINVKDIPPEEGEIFEELMLVASEMASVPFPKLKNLTGLRTEHQVYGLPDLHPVLRELGEREPNDSCPYLLAVWTPENLNRDDCLPQADIVYGTILIPARTAMKGMFPLNGTYFQANEVFADDESSAVPVKVPRVSLWHLPHTTLYCGNNMSAICRGMDTFEVQKCFRRGFVCFRTFNRKTREPKPLSSRFHLPPSKAEKPSDRKKKNSNSSRRRLLPTPE